VLPTDVVGLSSGVVSITGGHAHTCALTIDGGAKCWGGGAVGELGDGGTNRYQTTPVDVSGFTSGTAAVTTGEHFSCVLSTAGSAYCFGDNRHGQIGDGTKKKRLVPTGVVGLS
jgi:alpha-tubulin suppressor-like RCC1 family protein